jgi:hypothetical protein
MKLRNQQLLILNVHSRQLLSTLLAATAMVVGVSCPIYAQSSNPSDAQESSSTTHAGGGWLDQAFGLDPHKSFVEGVMNPLIGPDGVFKPQADDSNLKKVGKAGGIFITMPVWAPALFGGIALDEINHAPLGLYGHESPGPEK